MKLTIDLSYELIDEIANRIDWNKLLIDNPRLPIEFIQEYEDYINFDILFSMKPLNYNLIAIFKNHINGDVISKRNDIPLEILKHISEITSLNWKLLTENYFTYDFIEMFKDKPLDWHYITRECELLYIPSKVFVRNDWDRCENFISIFKDYVNWALISYDQFNDDFINEHAEYVDWNTYIINYFVDEELIIKNIDYIDLNLVAKYQYISMEFIETYSNNMRSDLLLDNQYIEEIYEEIFSFYKKKLEKFYTSSKNSKNNCMICMDEMDACCKITCNHEFHEQCISEWLLKNEIKSCPLCRYKL